MRKSALYLSPLALLVFSVGAQNQGYRGPIPELSFNNTFRVVCTCTHPTTGNFYPWMVTQLTAYNQAAGPGVPKGSRAYTSNPQLRAQAGTQSGQYTTIRGVTQAIYAGPAVTAFPAPNHYQFKTGIAPATVSATSPYLHEHAKTGNDIFSVKDQAVAITAWAIFEHSTVLTTPIKIPQKKEWLMFVEFRGGEYRDDANGGQTIAADWKGGPGPGGLNYSGWATPGPNRTSAPSGTAENRPKIGLLIDEPVLTATGNHANQYHTPALAGEEYRGIGAARAPWSTATASNLFFNLRAGGKYGSGGRGVVMLNVSKFWFPGSIWTPFGNLLLNPGDPGLGALSQMQLLMIKNGIYDTGDKSAIAFPPLGPAAKGMILKAQGVVWNPNFKDVRVTTSSSILID